MDQSPSSDSTPENQGAEMQSSPSVSQTVKRESGLRSKIIKLNYSNTKLLRFQVSIDEDMLPGITFTLYRCEKHLCESITFKQEHYELLLTWAEQILNALEKETTDIIYESPEFTITTKKLSFEHQEDKMVVEISDGKQSVWMAGKTFRQILAQSKDISKGYEDIVTEIRKTAIALHDLVSHVFSTSDHRINLIKLTKLTGTLEHWKQYDPKNCSEDEEYKRQCYEPNVAPDTYYHQWIK